MCPRVVAILFKCGAIEAPHLFLLFRCFFRLLGLFGYDQVSVFKDVSGFRHCKRIIRIRFAPLARTKCRILTVFATLVKDICLRCFRDSHALPPLRSCRRRKFAGFLVYGIGFKVPGTHTSSGVKHRPECPFAHVVVRNHSRCIGREDNSFSKAARIP